MQIRTSEVWEGFSRRAIAALTFVLCLVPQLARAQSALVRDGAITLSRALRQAEQPVTRELVARTLHELRGDPGVEALVASVDHPSTFELLATDPELALRILAERESKLSPTRTPCVPQALEGSELIANIDDAARMALAPSALTHAQRLELIRATMPELETTARELTDDALAIIEKCGKNNACIVQAIEEGTRKGRFGRFLKDKLCIARKPDALKGMTVSWLLYFSGLSTAYALSDEAERYPADLLFADTVAILLYWEVGCRGQLESDKNAPRIKRWARSYWRYVKWTPLEMVMYPGAAMAYDAILGDDVFSDEKIRKYLSEGMFVFAWNVSFALPLEVTIMDPLYLDAFPALRKQVNGLVERGILTPLGVKNGVVGRFVRVAGKGPGYGAEGTAQWLLGTGMSWLFIEGRARTSTYTDPWLKEVIDDSPGESNPKPHPEPEPASKPHGEAGPD